MAGEIRVISTSMVQARNNKEQQRIELTPSDIKCLTIGPIQKGLLFHKSSSSVTGRTFAEHLHDSLSATLDIFFPLAGRFSTVERDDNYEETISFFIDCNNQGAQFVHAAADHVRVADILEPIYIPSIVHSFFTLNGISCYEGVSKPLLGVQVTELVDGIFIGCTMNHSVADGCSFWNFFNSWSEISRGSNQISNFPVFDRPHYLFGGTEEVAIRIPPSLMKVEDHEITPSPQSLERIFRFSKRKIVELKAKAQADQAGGSENISSLQSVLTHIWRSAIRNRGVNPDRGETTTLSFSIGFRERIQPPLPKHYFGNAFHGEFVSLKEQDLVLDQGLGYAAAQICRKVALYTGEKVTSSLQNWVQNPKLLTLQTGVANNTLFVSSSPRYDVYGNDFGWGKPIAVLSGPGNKFGRKLNVYQGQEEGSIDVEVCVSPQVLEAMGNDLEFMDAVTL